MCQAQLEQELDDLRCSRDANEEAMIAELMKEGSGESNTGHIGRQKKQG